MILSCRQTVLALTMTILLAPGAAAQSSPNYRMDRVTVAGGAAPASSVNFTLTVTAAQEGPVGSVSRCNASLLQSTGFWSILGEVPVPVFLTVHRDGGDPSLPRLNWSGSSSQFVLYRATMAQGVVDPANEILVTNACTAVDTPPPAGVTYYVVRATGN